MRASMRESFTWKLPKPYRPEVNNFSLCIRVFNLLNLVLVTHKAFQSNPKVPPYEIAWSPSSTSDEASADKSKPSPTPNLHKYARFQPPRLVPVSALESSLIVPAVLTKPLVPASNCSSSPAAGIPGIFLHGCTCFSTSSLVEV